MDVEPDGEQLEFVAKAHGEVAFDLSLPFWREAIVHHRIPRPEKATPAQLTDVLATASLKRFGDHMFGGEDHEREAQELRNLQVQLTDEERIRFATRFLELNDYLLCTAEFEPDDASGGGERVYRAGWVPRKGVVWPLDPVEKLHQAWVLHLRDEADQSQRLLGRLLPSPQTNPSCSS